MISIHEQINVIYGYLHGLWRYRWSALFISWIVAICRLDLRLFPS